MSIADQLHTYWNRRAPIYYIQDVFGRRILSQFIRQVQPASLVEVGCGPGTLFPLYHHVPRVVAVDWSREMLDRAEHRIARHGYSIKVKQLDIIQGFLEERFSVLVTRTCLMHIPPEHFERACYHVSLMSDELLLFEYWEQYVQKKLDWHNWRHDYMGVFTRLGYTVKDCFPRPDIKQVLYHFVKGEIIDG